MVSVTFRLRQIHVQSLNEVDFFGPKCTGPLWKRLRLKCLGILSHSSSEFSAAINLINVLETNKLF